MRRLSMLMIGGLAILALGGCAERGASPAGEHKPTAEEKYPPAPAKSPMSKVQPGMTEPQVMGILGAPDDSKAYITGKAFIPWYFGPDQSRFACYYKGKGRVIFSGGNQWGAGRGKVVRVEYDPSEDGSAATK